MHYIPEDGTLHIDLSEALKYCITVVYVLPDRHIECHYLHIIMEYLCGMR
jgi:hypothetical protein